MNIEEENPQGISEEGETTDIEVKTKENAENKRPAAKEPQEKNARARDGKATGEADGADSGTADGKAAGNTAEGRAAGVTIKDMAAEREEVQKAGRKKTGKKAAMKRLKERAGRRKRLILRLIELKRLKRVRRKTVPSYTHCKNCGAELKGMYCHRCGQYALDVEQPFWKYFRQYFENVYQFDSKVWVTLWMLFRRPGFLTSEFNAGKIVSYVHPMKLLMFITVLFFLFFFSIAGEWLHVVNAPAVADEPSAYTLERTMFENEFIGYAGKWTPILVLLLAPFMAFLCRILYRKHSTGYMGNFAFVLHLNSVTFISLAAYLLLYRFFPTQSILWTWIFLLYLLYYTTAASHTVYTGTGWAKCAVKSVLMWTAFLLVVASALIGLTVLIAMKMDVL